MKPTKVYRLLLGAGFPAGAAVVMTAIAGAESGWNPGAVGDVSLQNSQWGPSVGLFQIRTLKAQTGTGGPRDIRRLRNNPTAQAAAAHQIWTGSGFTAWSTYTNGSYRRYLTPAHHAGARVRPGAVSASSTTQPAGWGGLLNPFNWPGAIGGAAGDAAGSAAGAVWGQVQPFILTMGFATAGLALVVIGVTVTARPAVDAASAKVDQIRQEAAKAATSAAVVA